MTIAIGASKVLRTATFCSFPRSASTTSGKLWRAQLLTAMAKWLIPQVYPLLGCWESTSELPLDLSAPPRWQPIHLQQNLQLVSSAAGCVWCARFAAPILQHTCECFGRGQVDLRPSKCSLIRVHFERHKPIGDVSIGRDMTTESVRYNNGLVFMEFVEREKHKRIDRIVLSGLTQLSLFYCT